MAAALHAGAGAVALCDPFREFSQATAPAQRVAITLPLDADLDPATFELTEIAFGDQMISVPAGNRYFDAVRSMTVDGHASRFTWTRGFAPMARSTPTSGASSRKRDCPRGGDRFPPPEPAYEAGNPNAPVPGRGRGRGHVSYTIRPKAGLPTGSEIRSVAQIVFDTRAPIATNQVDPHNVSKGTDPNKEALVTILDIEGWCVGESVSSDFWASPA